MPRMYNTLTRIHADPVRRRRVWCALSRLMGGAFASWHPEMFKDKRRQKLREPDWFVGKECIGVPLADYQAMDGTEYTLEESNSVRACDIESLWQVVEEAQRETAAAKDRSPRKRKETAGGNRNGWSVDDEGVEPDDNGVEHDLAELFVEIKADMQKFGCVKVRVLLDTVWRVTDR